MVPDEGDAQHAVAPALRRGGVLIAHLDHLVVSLCVPVQGEHQVLDLIYLDFAMVPSRLELRPQLG